jgi:hypothetical protein
MDANRCIAFEDHRCIARGDLAEVAAAVKAVVDQPSVGAVLIFDEVSSRPVELDLRGSREQVLARIRNRADLAESKFAPRTRGRPRLGVVSREVTLLPRHWAWLANQTGGASATLRRLVDQARKGGSGREKARQAQDSAYRFMLAMGGDLPGFEEALRSLYAGDQAGFETNLGDWPEDVAEHALRLAKPAFLPAN